MSRQFLKILEFEKNNLILIHVETQIGYKVIYLRKNNVRCIVSSRLEVTIKKMAILIISI